MFRIVRVITANQSARLCDVDYLHCVAFQGPNDHRGECQFFLAF